MTDQPPTPPTVDVEAVRARAAKGAYFAHDPQSYRLNREIENMVAMVRQQQDTMELLRDERHYEWEAKQVWKAKAVAAEAEVTVSYGAASPTARCSCRGWNSEFQEYRPRWGER